MPSADHARSMHKGRREAGEKMPGTRSDDGGDGQDVETSDLMKRHLSRNMFGWQETQDQS